MKKLVPYCLLVAVLFACNPSDTGNKVVTTQQIPDTIAAKSVPGPDTAVKITVAYAKMVAKETYFWAWPMVNIYNRRLFFSQVKDFALAGPIVLAPLNQVGMLTDYVDPAERSVACPNQDVVYGIGSLALDQSPVVVQVPDFGDRFWVYQAVDLRTDGFAQLGKMYGTQPGFYLLAGPDWKGDVPKGITKVFHCSTNTGLVVPRIFMDDTPEDRITIQAVLKSVVVYPLADFDGKMKTKEWSQVPKAPAQASGSTETAWVVPDKFFDELPTVLADATPLPGEEARYAQVLAVLAAAKKDPALKAAMIQAAAETEEQVINPLFQFRNWGRQLPFHWSTINNEAAFGTDYFTRTATAKSNILVNAPAETKYFYQDLDKNGDRLNSANHYTVTFAKGQTPPVKGFWSLTMYNEYHFFEPNPLNRFSLGTKNKNLQYNSDGSLTIYVQPAAPGGDKDANWLPAPKGAFTLYLRAYWPKEEVIAGTWTPPAVEKTK